MEDYSGYFLTGNPFPYDPAVKPFYTPPDPRMDGTIFNGEIRQRELRELRDKIESKLPMVYLRAPFRVRGMGKSAIAVQEWKRLKQFPELTSVYVKVGAGSTPMDFSDKVVRIWHENGYLWNVLTDLLKRFVHDNPSSAISVEVVEDIVRSHPTMPNSIDLRRYIYKGSVPAVLRKLADWASNLSRSSLPEVADIFFKTYLSKPWDFIRAYTNIKRKLRGYDEIDFFRSILELMKFSRYKYHYIFLDQFEYAVKAKGKGKDLIKFVSDMRRFLEAGIGSVSVCVTIHLDASTLLGLTLCSPLTEVAPLDPRYIVEIDELDAEQSCQLTLTYLEHFRGSYNPPDLFYPFRKDAIAYIRDEVNGNTRRALKALYFAIDEGIKKGFPPISKDFIRDNHVSILGRVAEEV